VASQIPEGMVHDTKQLAQYWLGGYCQLLTIALEKWNSGRNHHYLSLIIILAQIISYGYLLATDHERQWCQERDLYR